MSYCSGWRARRAFWRWPGNSVGAAGRPRPFNRKRKAGPPGPASTLSASFRRCCEGLGGLLVYRHVHGVYRLAGLGQKDRPLVSLDSLAGDDALLDVAPRGYLVHHIEEDVLHHGGQAAGACLVAAGLVR